MCYSSTTNTFPRPFKLHFGVSFAGKRPDSELLQARQKGRFSVSSPVGQWRDQLLTHKKEVPSLDAGQDFWYIQEVSTDSLSNLMIDQSRVYFPKMRNKSVGETMCSLTGNMRLNNAICRVCRLASPMVWVDGSATALTPRCLVKPSCITLLVMQKMDGPGSQKVNPMKISLRILWKAGNCFLSNALNLLTRRFFENVSFNLVRLMKY